MKLYFFSPCLALYQLFFLCNTEGIAEGSKHILVIDRVQPTSGVFNFGGSDISATIPHINLDKIFAYDNAGVQLKNLVATSSSRYIFDTPPSVLVNYIDGLAGFASSANDANPWIMI